MPGHTWNHRLVPLDIQKFWQTLKSILKIRELKLKHEHDKYGTSLKACWSVQQSSVEVVSFNKCFHEGKSVSLDLRHSNRHICVLWSGHKDQVGWRYESR